MQGFITESVSKITDGLGSAVQLIVIAAATTLLFIPINQSANPILTLVYLGLLYAAGIYFLSYSLKPGETDAQRASWGMLAGLFLWQGMQHSGFWIKLGIFTPGGFIFWFVALLIVLFLWNRVFPVGLRFLLLLLLLNWLGKLYVNSAVLTANWPEIWSTLYQTVRYAAMVGIAVSLWFIILRSRNILQRKYAAAALYFFVLLSTLLF